MTKSEQRPDPGTRAQVLPARSRATLRDVARLADVHTSTVSRALSGSTRSMVNPHTVERVLAAAAYLDYRPNAIARGLKTSRSSGVGVLVPDLLNPVVPPIVRGIEAVLGEAGYVVMLGNANHSRDRERLFLEMFQVQQVEGIVAFTASDETLGLLDGVIHAQVPVVLVNRTVPDGSIAAAAPDNAVCSSLAVEHLAQLGHSRIAHIAGPRTTSTGLGRRQGFEAAIASAGLDRDPRLIIEASRYTEDEGARCCRELLAYDKSFTAIVAANDLFALGCYDALEAADLRCPDDISIVGCNDMPFTDRFAPPMTTVNIAREEMGQAAAELLLQVIEKPELPPRQIVIAPKLVVRKSTGPVPTVPKA
jgi:LacI family transcriptional regulator